MENNIHETTKEIKKSLRLSMNGIVSAHQRRQGLNYKINFGVEIPRLKEIASTYNKEKELAQNLWQDNIRECKLLAIFLYPTKEFDTATAEKWIAECQFTEIADHLCRTLLTEIPEAVKKSLQWIAHKGEIFEYCGYSTLSNLFTKKATLTDEEEKAYYNALKQTLHTPGTSNHPTKNAANISLIKFAEQSKEQCQRACAEIKSWGIEENSALNNLVENLLEETD
ncbi:MAG: DNA alkylation repair protein [Bacteroidales bacterium]|nr:DNA alkylation repair protein [Bacteroidales bacterium]MBR2607726.1 DNA alkylation repair protein [Bacteroidaceae bacterium]